MIPIIDMYIFILLLPGKLMTVRGKTHKIVIYRWPGLDMNTKHVRKVLPCSSPTSKSFSLVTLCCYCFLTRYCQRSASPSHFPHDSWVYLSKGHWRKTLAPSLRSLDFELVMSFLYLGFYGPNQHCFYRIFFSLNFKESTYVCLTI